ncbi:MAG: KR domain-containing protein, partial [bacterium]|nr:KR domain-containing protein [bacterium]
DVADEEAMRSAIGRAERRFGELHGVIYASGALADDRVYHPLSGLGREQSEKRFRATAHGVIVLERVLARRQLDFVLLFSSTASVLGGLGLAACAASDRFMDAVVVARNAGAAGGGPAWISSSWDRWPGTGETGPGTGETGPTIKASTDELTLTVEQRREALLRVLRQAPEGRIIVSTGDLFARLNLWIERGPERPERRGTLHDRPDLATDYVAPRSELEKQIAAVWQDLLGVRQVGIHDSFFDLGGDSFLAVQVISRLRQALHRDVPVVSLYEGLTIQSLAALLEGEEESSAEQEAQLRELEGARERRRQYQQKRRAAKKGGLATP